MLLQTLQDFRSYFYKEKNCPDSQPCPLEKVYNWRLEQKLTLPFCLSSTSPNHSQYVIIDDRATYLDPPPTLTGYA